MYDYLTPHYLNTSSIKKEDKAPNYTVNDFLFPYLAKLSAQDIDFCHSLEYRKYSEMIICLKGDVFLEPLAVSLFKCIRFEFDGKKVKHALLVFSKIFGELNEMIGLPPVEDILMEESGLKTYLIKDSNTELYKIGKSKNPLKREKTLQGEKPTLEIVKTWNEDIEKILHQKYKKNRIRGEWFKLTEIQIKYICTTNWLKNLKK